MPVLADTPESRAAKAQHSGEWAGWVAALPEDAKAALREYGILGPDNHPIIVNLGLPKERPLGMGPKMSLVSASRLIDADTTPEKKWARWILYQAGGGDTGKQASKTYMNLMHDNFIKVNTTKAGKREKPMTPEQAEREWQKNLPDFTEILNSADQDIVGQLHVFGYYRDWPGQQGVYEKVASAVTGYMANYTRLVAMNKELEHDGEPVVGMLEPKDVPSVEEMKSVVEKVKRYFAAKKARTDIRLATWKQRDTIYDDDYITAIAPLTYATAVRYGFDSWSWANRRNFNRAVMGDARGNEWEKFTRNGYVFVILTFNVPTPVKVVRKGGMRNSTLTNLALYLQTGTNTPTDVDMVTVWDEENNQNSTVGALKTTILSEPQRAETNEPGLPFKRARVYKTPEEEARYRELSQRVKTGQRLPPEEMLWWTSHENKPEAEEVVRHLDLCVREVLDWARNFDIKQLQSRVLGYED